MATEQLPAPGVHVPARAVSPPARRSAAEVGRALLALTKPRIVELLLVTTVPAMLLADHGVPSLALMVATVTGGALTAGGANALNMVCDRDIDATMSRTKRRPLVTGILEPRMAVVFATALELAGFVILWAFANLLAAALAVGAAAFYVGVYTLVLKRSTAQNIVIGGAAGAAPVLVGWAAVTGRLAPAAWGLFAVIFLWTPPHFWALSLRFRDDYARANVPMLPTVTGPRQVANRILGYTIVLSLASVAVGVVCSLGPVYTVGAAVLGVLFIERAWRLRLDPAPKPAMRLFRYSIVYLTIFFVLVGLTALLP